MPGWKLKPKAIVSLLLASLLFIGGAAWQNIRAQAAGVSPASASPNGAVPVPPNLPPPQAPDQPAALSSTLSYYFISGNTFVATAALSSYYNFLGCLAGSPSTGVVAPVHLPQGSLVVALGLFTYDTAVTTSVSTANFLLNNGLGFETGTLVVQSAPNSAGYQHHESTGGASMTIDNQNYSYFILWGKQGGDASLLQLCGARLSYYAPLSANFLPDVLR